MKIIGIKIGLVILSFSTFIIAKAQVFGEITYIEQYQNDIESTYKLFFNQEASVYEEDLSKTKFGQNILPQPDGTFNVITIPYRKEPLFIYTSRKEKMRIFENFNFGSVADRFEAISWQLYEDTKQIGSFICQKAVGNFRGRNYTVWFTTDIPVSFGPWKLEGLNGLILEVSEEFGSYKAIATEINIYETETSGVKEKLDFYTKTVPEITFEEYLTSLSNYNEKYEKIVNAKLSKGETPMTDNYIFWSLEIFDLKSEKSKN